MGIRRTVAGVLAAAAIAGGFSAAAAPAQAAETTNAAVTVSTISEVKAADVTPQAWYYRGSYYYLSTCSTAGQSWVASGAARAYNCGLDNRYPGLPWSLYTFH